MVKSFDGEGRHFGGKSSSAFLDGASVVDNLELGFSLFGTLWFFHSRSCQSDEWCFGLTRDKVSGSKRGSSASSYRFETSWKG